MTFEFGRIFDIWPIWIPTLKAYVSNVNCERQQSYTRNVLSAEPVAISVPRGFQETDRKLLILSASGQTWLRRLKLWNEPI